MSIEDPECQSTLLLFSPLDLQSSLTIFRSTTAIVFLVYKPCLDNSDRGSHKSIDNLTLATIKIFILNHRSKNSIIAIVILIINRALGVPPLNGLTYYGLRRFSLQCSSFLRSQCPIQSSRIFSQWQNPAWPNFSPSQPNPIPRQKIGKSQKDKNKLLQH